MNTNLRTIYTTLTLIENGNKILLGQKKRGFAKGTYNGFGGKQEIGETIFDAMIRETQEEIDVTPLDARLVANIDFFNIVYKGENANINMSVYLCSKFDGEINETNEMIPEWFDKGNLPYDKMLPDDIHWFKKVMSGKFIKAEFTFDNDIATIVDQKITETSEQELQNLVQDKTRIREI